MKLETLYSGGFTSVGGKKWTVEIWKQNSDPFIVEEVAFSSSPLEIEWLEVDKLEPICSSKATLTLFCDKDREFMNLYTITPGEIGLRVKHDGNIYWCGTLDPELYEEPFSYKENYEVTLTFSDLAILDRIEWGDSNGFMTIRQILMYSLIRAKLWDINGIEEYISTKIVGETSEKLLDEVSINTDNFYDEDGTPMTLREVLEETLRPFGLRLIQKGGKIIIYDLHSLSTKFSPIPIHWESDDAILGVDKVYNNVKVNFSPYIKTELLNGKVDESSLTDLTKELHILTEKPQKATISTEGFNLSLYDKGKGITKNKQAKFFQIDPIYSGNKDTGIAWTINTILSPDTEYERFMNHPSGVMDKMLFKIDELTYINGEKDPYKSNYRLKILLDFLFDVRYNPFEEAGEYNEKENYEKMNKVCNMVKIPILLTIRDENGKALCHWKDDLSTGPRTTRSERPGSDRYPTDHWLDGEGEWGDSFLSFYDPNDRQDSAGVGSWQENKPEPERSPNKLGNGKYITLPPKSGWLELQVGTGIQIFDYKSNNPITDEIFNITNWVLYKNPTVTLVDTYGKKVNPKDIEYDAWIIDNAREGIKIDTLVGTIPEHAPTALGQLVYTKDRSPVQNFFRADKTDLLERLLITTVYSNYAKRQNTLSGTVSLIPKFSSHINSKDKEKYILLSELQHLRDDESEIKMTILNEDDYTNITIN